MKTIIQDFKASLSKIDPQFTSLFNSAATENEINEAEQHIAVQLPGNLRELYLSCNGQSQGAGIFCNWSFLPLEELRSEWQNWNDIEEFYKVSFSIDACSIPRGHIKELYTSPKWIPFATDFCGNNLGYDTDPGPEGTFGQIIVFGRDYDTKYVLAASLEKFVEIIINKLDLKQYESEDGYLYVNHLEDEKKELSPRSFRDSLSFYLWKMRLGPIWNRALGNYWDDISSKEDIKNIDYLLLLKKGLRNLTPLRNFTELRDLVLSANPITSIKELEDCKYLKKLTIAKTKVKDLQGIEELKELATLSLHDTPIANLRHLSKSVSLKSLNISSTKIDSIEEILALTNLIKLNISKTKVSDVSGLSNFQFLHELDISSTRISSIRFIEEIPNLSSIDISGLSIEDFTPLNKTQKIQEIRCNFEQFIQFKETLSYKPNIAMVGKMTDDQKKVWMDFLHSEEDSGTQTH